MAAVVTLTVDQLQGLLQAQTQQLQEQFTTQISTLQTNLETSIEETLQSKFDQAEENVKQFMKDTIEDEDEEEEAQSEVSSERGRERRRRGSGIRLEVESTMKTQEDMKFIKDHLLQVEQSLNMLLGTVGDGSYASLSENNNEDQLLPATVEGSHEEEEDKDEERDTETQENAGFTPASSEFPFPRTASSGTTPSATLARPMLVQRSSSAGNPNPTALMEKMVFDCCTRLEQMLEKKFGGTGTEAGTAGGKSGGRRPNPRRSQSMDNTGGGPGRGGGGHGGHGSHGSHGHHGSGGGGGGGNGFGSAVHALRATQKYMEDELETRFGNLEQFIDARHAEMEAYHGSSFDNLKKLILETISDGGNAAGGGSNTSNRSLGGVGGGGMSSGSGHPVVPATPGGTPLTREELEAVLDARISAEEAAEEEEAAAAASDADKPLTREELEAVLDARIIAEEEKERERRRSSTDSSLRPLTRAELEAVLDARITAEEEEEARRMEQQRNTQAAAESTDSEYDNFKGIHKSLHTAMEKLIRQQQEWIDVQSSTRDLEQQVQTKLEQLESSGGSDQQNSNNNVVSKLESLERLVLAAIASGATTTTTGSSKKKQRASSKKPNKKLSQVIRGDGASSSQRKTHHDGTASRSASRRGGDDSRRGTSSIATPRASNPYDGISLDEKGLVEEEQEQKGAQQQGEEQGGGGGDHVQSFMNTLTKFKEINKQQEEYTTTRDHRMDTSEDIEGDDDIDSNASMSVDSSVEDNGGAGGAGGGAGMEDDPRVVLKTLRRLESKLDQLDEKFPEPGTVASPLTFFQPPDRERSTNARHSRDVVTESIEASIRAEHSKLKQWIIDQQQDEMNVSESGRVPGSGGGGADPSFSGIMRAMVQQQPDSPGGTTTRSSGVAAIDPKLLQSIQEKLNVIEDTVSTNQSFLQEELRQARQLPLVQQPPGTTPGSSNATIDMERRILSNLSTLERNVNYKLDGIFSEVQKGGGGSFSRLNTKMRDDSGGTGGGEDGGNNSSGDWMSSSDLPEEFVNLIERKLEELTTHLKENIPDYGMAQSVLTEQLADIKSIVSEVAISEVEMLKTQLGVAEEAEQEALQAIMVMKQQVEEAKESERRALQVARVAPPPPPPQSADMDPAAAGVGSLWDLGVGSPFGQLISQQLGRRSSGTAGGGDYRQGSYPSGLSLGASGRQGGASNRDPKRKIEQWKSQILDLDDKATDLRTMYSQLRGQKPDDWLGQRGSGGGAGGGGGGLGASNQGRSLRVGESKEMVHMEIQVPHQQQREAVPDLAPIPAVFNKEDGGDWI